jgi:peroxiredoxin
MALAVGDLAPRIDLVTADGAAWHLGDQRGHAAVLVFHRHLA